MRMLIQHKFSLRNSIRRPSVISSSKYHKKDKFESIKGQRFQEAYTLSPVK
jgi:hypothetical protein